MSEMKLDEKYYTLADSMRQKAKDLISKHQENFNQTVPYQTLMTCSDKLQHPDSCRLEKWS